MTAFRVGTGTDIHRFGEGDHIFLGGVKIPHQQGLVAHSDGDVLLHALCDAMLGALALGDIGKFFPDSDPKWQDASSRLLAQEVLAMVKNRGWQLANVDTTIFAEVPKIGPWVATMQQTIAADLDLDVTAIGIKATTNEGLGFIGRKEGIAVQAMVLLQKLKG